jgi:AraC family transcriptional regulator, regulatory protein of adaptative response / methylated-DNA-[protein]-cysteine methyltransferase
MGSRQQLSATADENDLWRAVLARDAGRDGSFVYAVRSTGIFCRPSCASRRPRRDRVVFFAVPEAARAAGYRPCRRCRPQRATGDPNVDLVRQTCQRINATLASPEERVTLRGLGDALGVSPYQLQRTFKRITGITPRQYADACRLGRLKARLKERRTVTMSLLEAGYGSSSRLYEQAGSQLGMTPATYRRGGVNVRIGYTVVSCPLGRLLMAATERGVSAVYLGDDDGILEAALAKEYPAAEIRRDDVRLQRWVEEIVNHLSNYHPHLDLPVDVQATAFQRRVWQELQAIPYGSTRSYREVAEALGRPSASRAVARACATNPVSIIVPCHRVVRGDGSLGGYRWGLNRKRALLEQESRAASK